MANAEDVAAAPPPARGQLDWRRVRSAGIFVASLMSGLLFWHFSSVLFFNAYLLPPPATVLKAAWETLLSGEVLEMVRVSLVRILMGFGLGCLVGITCGLIMGSFRVAGEFLDPLIEVIRPISPVAMIPIAIVWFGIDEASKYFIIAYGVFFTTLINTIAGVRHTPLVRTRAAASLGAGRWSLFFRIMLPSAMPFINTGMRVALGGAFMSVVAAEMIAANSGVGYFIMQARLLVQTERIFVGLMMLGLTGFLTDRVYRYLSGMVFARYLRLSA
jgi:NitT/TauT family transport system permease protein/taurine transport system permease protein